MNGVVTLPVSGERAGKLQALLFYIKVKIFLKHRILQFNIKREEFMDSLNIENTVLSLEMHLNSSFFSYKCGLLSAYFAKSAYFLKD